MNNNNNLIFYINVYNYVFKIICTNHYTCNLICIIPKKYLKLSNRRNKLKRIIKESFNLTKYYLPSLKYIVILKSKILLFNNKNLLFNLFIKIWINFIYLHLLI